MFVAIYYISVEAYRFELGMSFRFPFSTPHWETYPILGIIPGAFSLSITRIILKWSIRIIGNRKFGTLGFGVMILVCCIINLTIADIMFPTLKIAIDVNNALFATLAGMLLHGEVFRIMVKMVDGQTVDFGQYLMLSGTKWIEIVKTYVGTAILRVPNLYAFRDLIKAGATENNLSIYYLQWVKAMFVYLRIDFAVIFIFAWAIVRPVHRAIELIFRRILEAEKGPLATVAAFLAAMVKLVELLLRC
jgi:hypothetical protein